MVLKEKEKVALYLILSPKNQFKFHPRMNPYLIVSLLKQITTWLLVNISEKVLHFVEILHRQIFFSLCNNMQL